MTPNIPRILHAALTVGAIVTLVAFVLVSRVAPAPAADLTTVLRAAAGAEILTMVVLMKLVAGRVEPLGMGEDADAWWRTQAPRAIVLWALAEGSAALGAVFWFLSRDQLLLVALGGFGLGALLWLRPGRLIAG